MAIQNGTGAAMSMGKLALALGKGHAAYAATGTILALSLGAAVLAAFAGAVLLVGITNFETSEEFSQSDISQNEVKLR